MYWTLVGWRNGTFLQVNALPISAVDNGATELAVIFLRVRKPLLNCTGCATPPHIHPMSWYITAHDKFYQAFPCISTASERPWYEASQALPPCVFSSLFRHCYMILYTCSCFDNYISASCIANTMYWCVRIWGGLNAYVPVWGLKWLSEAVLCDWRDSYESMHTCVCINLGTAY